MQHRQYEHRRQRQQLSNNVVYVGGCRSAVDGDVATCGVGTRRVGVAGGCDCYAAVAGVGVFGGCDVDIVVIAGCDHVGAGYVADVVMRNDVVDIGMRGVGVAIGLVVGV